MPFDFETEFSQLSDRPEDIASQVVEEAVGVQELDIPEVDRRIEILTHFRLVLDNSLFDSTSPYARMVETEIKEFVRGRLRVLLGMEATPLPVAVPTELPFSLDQIEALKALADKVIRKPSVLETKAPAPKPTLRPVQSSPKSKIPLRKTETKKPVTPVTSAPKPNDDGKVEVELPDGRKVRTSKSKTAHNSAATPMPNARQMELLAMQSALSPTPVQSAEPGVAPIDFVGLALQNLKGE